MKETYLWHHHNMAHAYGRCTAMNIHIALGITPHLNIAIQIENLKIR